MKRNRDMAVPDMQINPLWDSYGKCVRFTEILEKIHKITVKNRLVSGVGDISYKVPLFQSVGCLLLSDISII